jgi:hypothetical protein
VENSVDLGITKKVVQRLNPFLDCASGVAVSFSAIRGFNDIEATFPNPLISPLYGFFG